MFEVRVTHTAKYIVESRACAKSVNCDLSNFIERTNIINVGGTALLSRHHVDVRNMISPKRTPVIYWVIKDHRKNSEQSLSTIGSAILRGVSKCLNNVIVSTY